ncbi:MAG: hypothetical protein NWF07_16595, partial [Candidatus Bathyarchaeota archaeon]|nr:hypothetical protein [Candidatus Bathyarchaeota archaeon]
MFNKIKELLNRSTDEPRFTVKPHRFGVSFLCDSLEDCRAARAPEMLQMQYIALRMLVEQGIASEITDGFEVFSEDVVGLEPSDRLLLGLPEPWRGEFRVSFKGVSTQPSFEIDTELVLPSGDRIRHFTTRGPYLQLSENEIYLPDAAQWILLSAVLDHQELGPGEKSEENNLLAVKKLQLAGALGVAADLSHFDDIAIETPSGVSFSAIQKDDGSLELLPSFRTIDPNENEDVGESNISFEIATPEDIAQRIGHLEHGDAVFRVRNKVVVLDESQMEGVEEIL